MHRVATVLSSGCLLAFSHFAAAAATSDPVIVTATRTAVTADQALASVTVITREDIERRQAQDILELLRTETGIDVSRTGGPGGTIDLFMRGTSSNHVLVLIDGMRVASATTGTFEFRNLSLGQIERIEIVRGPRATLYGSDAIGGVIQIFTRRPKGAAGAVGLGSYGTASAEAGLGGGRDLRGSVTTTYFGNTGFSAQNEKGGSFDPDKDGYRNRAINGMLALPLSAGTELELRGWRATSDIEFDIGESDAVNEALSGTVRGRLANHWSHALSLGYALDDLDTAASFPSHIISRRRTADWQNDLAVSDNQLLTLGLSYQEDSAVNRDTGSASTVFDETTYNRAIFALWQGQWKPLNMQVSARHDDHSRFGSHQTGSFAIGGDVSSASRLRFSYGTGFRAPTLNELFHPGFSFGYAGNPTLGPERSRSAEIGLTTKQTPGERFGISVYQTNIEDLIAFEGTNNQAVNIGQATVRGAEFTYDLAYASWTYHAGATLQRARNDITNAELLRRPDAKLSTQVQRDFSGGASLGAEIILSSDAADFGARVPGYGVVNVAGQLPLAAGLRLLARLENAFDSDYQIANGFNTVGRAIFVTLRYEAPPDR